MRINSAHYLISRRIDFLTITLFKNLRYFKKLIYKSLSKAIYLRIKLEKSPMRTDNLTDVSLGLLVRKRKLLINTTLISTATCVIMGISLHYIFSGEETIISYLGIIVLVIISPLIIAPLLSRIRELNKDIKTKCAV